MKSKKGERNERKSDINDTTVWFLLWSKLRRFVDLDSDEGSRRSLSLEGFWIWSRSKNKEEIRLQSAVKSNGQFEQRTVVKAQKTPAHTWSKSRANWAAIGVEFGDFQTTTRHTLFVTYVVLENQLNRLKSTWSLLKMKRRPNATPYLRFFTRFF